MGLDYWFRPGEEGGEAKEGVEGRGIGARGAVRWAGEGPLGRAALPHPFPIGQASPSYQ